MRYQDYEIKIKEKQVHILKYYGSKKYVCIPSYIDEYPVTEIESEAFKDNAYLHMVCFPLCLNKIGKKAFMNCLRLEQINIPRNVITIGTSCFENCCSLKIARLPFYLKKISSRTFMNCSNLKTVEIPSLLTTVESKAFGNCKSLLCLSFPESLIELKDKAIYNCEKLIELDFGHFILSFNFSDIKSTSLTRFTSRNPLMHLTNLQDAPTTIKFYGYKNSTLSTQTQLPFIELKELEF